MLVWQLTLLLISGSLCGREELASEFHATPSRHRSRRIDNPQLHDDNREDHDAQHRGPNWYDYEDSAENSFTETDHGKRDATDLSSSSSITSSESRDASSAETDIAKVRLRPYRTCVPCQDDMMKAHNNMGIKWICGAYQRARRTFKSECMMRYRNCEDGTMFVRIQDYRCKNDTYHGRNWFYIYKV